MIKGDPWRFLLGVGWVGRTLLKEGPSGLRTEKYDEKQPREVWERTQLWMQWKQPVQRPEGQAGICSFEELEGRQVSVPWRTGRKGC